MDVSRVDPEDVLVDFQTLDAADLSGDLDEAWLKGVDLSHGSRDKVMVSVRSVSEPFSRGDDAH